MNDFKEPATTDAILHLRDQPRRRVVVCGEVRKRLSNYHGSLYGEPLLFSSAD